MFVVAAIGPIHFAEAQPACRCSILWLQECSVKQRFLALRSSPYNSPSKVFSVYFPIPKAFFICKDRREVQETFSALYVRFMNADGLFSLPCSWRVICGNIAMLRYAAFEALQVPLWPIHCLRLLSRQSRGKFVNISVSWWNLKVSLNLSHWFTIVHPQYPTRRIMGCQSNKLCTSVMEHLI